MKLVPATHERIIEHIRFRTPDPLTPAEKAQAKRDAVKHAREASIRKALHEYNNATALLAVNHIRGKVAKAAGIVLNHDSIIFRRGRR